MGCCPDYSGRFHSLNYRMRQKYGAEALQPRIPEVPISEPGVELIIGTFRPRTPKILISESDESDDEDMGLGLFED